MKKILFIIVILEMLISNDVLAQQYKWIIPTISSNGANHQLPYYNFTGPMPTVSFVNVSDYHSSQAVGNGEYCNPQCPSFISEFFITGDRNENYDDPIGSSNSSFQLQIQYEQIDSCNIKNEIFTSMPAVPLSHESLSEIAIGNGVSPGTYIAVMLGNTSPSIGGLEFYVYEFDFSNPNVNSNRITTLSGEIFSGRGINRLGTGTYFNEGVALGTIFTYSGAAITNSASNTLLPGTIVRSIYVSSSDGFIYHLFIDPLTLDVFFSDLYDANTTGFGVYEMDLSFPNISNNNHPEYLALCGWNNALKRYYSIGQNGVINPTSETIHQEDSANPFRCLTVEFDKTNSYLYYDHHGDLYRHDLSSATFSSSTDDLVMDNANGTYIMVENAGNGNMYLNHFSQPILIEIPNPSSGIIPTPISVATYLSPAENAWINNNIQTNGSFGLTDWVDGEDPFQNQGTPLTICLEDCPEPHFQNSIYNANFSINGSPFRSINISPSDPCQTIFVCPNTTVDISMVVNGTTVNRTYNIATTPVSESIDLKVINQCPQSPNPDCCQIELNLKYTKDGDVANVPNGASWSQGIPLSITEESFEITNSSSIPITEMRVAILDFDFSSDIEECLTCIDNPGHWASLGHTTGSVIGNAATGLKPIPAYTALLGDRINQRELIWENKHGSMLTAGDKFNFNLVFPAFSKIPCCVTKVNVCYELSWKDANCNVCDTINCVEYDLAPGDISAAEFPIIESGDNCCDDKTLTLSGDRAATYKWSTGETTEQITVSKNGVYSVTVTSFGQSVVVSKTVSSILKGNFPTLTYAPQARPGQGQNFIIRDYTKALNAPFSYNANKYTLWVFNRNNTDRFNGAFRKITKVADCGNGLRNGDIQWDGRDNNGNKVQSGMYPFVLRLENCDKTCASENSVCNERHNYERYHYGNTSCSSPNDDDAREYDCVDCQRVRVFPFLPWPTVNRCNDGWGISDQRIGLIDLQW